ncbi:ATP-binding cassette subfamily G member 4-like [Neocloeon triangulifer]|uniref:ATP-binding cassette subfamily G member 4-like n=1 Tax=Neocloeon triangulifer TaxID=2078957 RepID=UPI00286F514C|nr:ATP-binding cassette subfamily G member 4-like [Neocloeon triangulifer]
MQADPKEQTSSQVDIEFQDLTYEAGNKTILRNLNGFFKSGQISGILGPSGAGKSSLMNILIGYKTSGVSGSILTNGRSRDLRHFHKISCFIQQEELVQPHLCVEEAMSVAACLKLGPSVTKEKRNNVISDILSTLGLTECQKTKTDKLSGGQKKRLSIALELISNPPVLFLDEPTTGLDVVAATQCMRHLSSLAAQGRTIVCTIHQPSASIFSLFQHVYFLAEGCCVYQGDTEHVIRFLTSAGLPCPQYSNPADHVVELSHASVANVRILSNAIQNGKITMGSNAVVSHLGCAIGGGDLSDRFSEFPTSARYQFMVLLCRMLLQTSRSKAMLRLLFTHHLVSALLLGGMFYDIGDDAGMAYQNIKFFICMIVFFLYAYMMAAVIVFPLEVKLLRREYFNRWYGLKPYFFALTVSRLPVQLTFGSMFILVSYYMTGQPLVTSRFASFATISLLNAATSESLGLLIGSLFSITYGSVIAPAVSGAFLMLAMYGIGFGPMMEPFWKIFQSFSYVRYVLSGYAMTMYGPGRNVLPCKEIYCHFRRPSELVKLMGMTGDNLALQITILAAFLLLFKVLSFAALRIRLMPEFNNRFLNDLSFKIINLKRKC